jgi:ribosomal protein L15E
MTTLYKPHSGGITPAELKEYEATLNNLAPTSDTPDDEGPNTPTTDSQDPAELSKQLEVANKRYFDLKKHHDNKITEERRAREEAETKAKLYEEQLSANKPSYAPDEAVKKFEDEYEVAPVLKELAARVSEERIQKAVQKIEESREREKKEAAQKQQDIVRLSQAHPDWAQLDADPIFNEWLNAQVEKNASIKRMANSGDIDDAILIFEMFKAHVRPKNSGTDKKELSKGPSGNSPADIPKPKNALSFSEWQKAFAKAEKSRNLVAQEKLLEEYDLARKENRLTN